MENTETPEKQAGGCLFSAVVVLGLFTLFFIPFMLMGSDGCPSEDSSNCERAILIWVGIGEGMALLSLLIGLGGGAATGRPEYLKGALGGFALATFVALAGIGSALGW